MNARLGTGWLLAIAAQLSAVGLLLTSAWLISRAAEHPPVLYLLVAIVAVRAFGVGRAALRYAERLVTHDAAFRMVTEERISVYAALTAAAPAGLPEERRGDIVSRVVSDIDALQDRQLRVRLPFAANLAAEVAVIALVAAIQLRAGLILGGVVALLQLGLPLLAARQGGVEQRSVARLRGQLAAELAESLEAAPDVIAYGATGLVKDEVHDTNRALARAQRRAAWSAGLGSSLVLLGVGTAVCLIAWSAARAVDAGQLKPVLLAVLVLAPIALLEPLDTITGIEQQRQRVRSSFERLRDLRELRSPVTEPATPTTLAAGFGLSVRDLRIGWDGRALAAPVSFELPEGAVLAVNGPSGSGKSTLAATLLKLLAPVSGTVLLAGVDLADLAGQDVRHRIGLLQQDGHIFATTIRENLRIAKPDATDAEFAQALSLAGLGAFVRGLPAGLDTELGDHGNRMSGGERQRLNLARLLLAGHLILILDEPTEHLDRPTAERLLEDVLALAPARSILINTHAPWVLERIGTAVAIAPAKPIGFNPWPLPH